MGEITLTSTEFRALSSDTRVQIIKLLKERNYTLTELSKKLNLSPPTIKQHLDTLVKSEIIELKDEGRKWKYYELTRKGKNIVEPSHTNVLIVIGANIVAIIVVLYFFGFALQASSSPIYAKEAVAPRYNMLMGTQIASSSQIDSNTKGASGEQKISQPAADTAGKTSETSEISGFIGSNFIELSVLAALALVLAVLLGFNLGKNARLKFG